MKSKLLEMDGELLSLKWNNHKSTFLQVIRSLRRKCESPYADATIACDGSFYPVHRLVLSSCSDYFSSIFDATSCKNPVIVLKDIDSKNFEYLLDYMYIGEVNVRHTELGALVGAAESLKIKGLAVPDDDVLKPVSEVKNLAAKSRLPNQFLASDSECKRRKLSKSSSVNENNNNNNISNNNNNKNGKQDELDNTTTPVKTEPVDEDNSLSGDTSYFNQSSPLTINKLEENDSNNDEQVLAKNEPVDVLDNSPNINEPFEYQNENQWKEQEFQSDILGIMSGVDSSTASSHDHMQKDSLCEPSLIEINSVASASDQTIDPLTSLQEQFGVSRPVNLRENFSSFLSGRFKQSSPRHLINCKTRLNKLKYRFSCQLCSYSSKEKANLKRHMMTHTGEKPFKCPICDYRSVAYHTIKRHFRTHTGEKPFACSVCEYRCSTSETLKNHLLKHTERDE